MKKTKLDPHFIDVTGIDKAELLMELFNRASSLDITFTLPKVMSLEEAQAIVSHKSDLNFPFLFKGRILDINITEDEINARRYNFFNGEGIAQEVVQSILQRREIIRTASVPYFSPSIVGYTLKQ